MPSDIQVFVKWKEQTIFAGEDVECIITFKNVAESSTPEPNEAQRTPHQRQSSRTITAGSTGDNYFSLKSPHNFFFNGNSRRSLPGSPRTKTFDRSHRPATSLGSPFLVSHSFPPLQSPSRLGYGQPSNHKHKRSVSILSIDSEGGNDKTPVPSHFSRPSPARGHGRSASLQVLPRRNEGYDEGSTTAGRNPNRAPPSRDSTLSPSTRNMRLDTDHQTRFSRPGSSTSPVIPPGSSRSPNKRVGPLPADFKFPPAPPTADETTGSNLAPSPSITSGDEAPTPAASLKSNARDVSAPLPPTHLPSVTRIISNSSMNGSNRSSGEFYSLSNNSSETLESEYASYSMNRARSNLSRHRRHFSSVDPVGTTRDTQTLLMGYAQISASFTVDGSLINQAAFEEVKRKGVLGGQGTAGGAPGGTEKPRKSGGLLGALGWSAIEESITGLLSSGDLDGLRDMRGVSSSNSIPLLSTPQSLLFVDLRLAPGEEKSFSFAFKLPRGLPASHKGKAIKFSYNLVIGTQRPSGPKEAQHVNRINVPFRVFSGVNAQGDILGHDLMVPYVILRDEARVRKLGSSPRQETKKSISGPTWTSAPEFLSYVDEILEQDTRRGSLLSPTSSQDKRPSQDLLRSPPSCKDAIDLAILRSNRVTSSNRSANRFEIARNGRRIAVVVLNRPAHRLGETIFATVDFTGAALPCYSLRGTLETSEKVNPSLAVRSSASIHRATRRIHASCFENTLFSTRVVFSPAIPITATPTILTSGVNLEWELRFEFVTSSHADDEPGPSGARLLEKIGEDDRGQLFSSFENISCESFEISIPVTVYGETVREPLPEENQGYSI
ncbi:hypothetical protein VTN00DRAFT_6930 [Thermoascus crustaceus]|uniref:uncharacterized protein n=1 Tax=Thermoascus crustaceus TaxID=5088 RepID=UPI0037438742